MHELATQRHLIDAWGQKRRHRELLKDWRRTTGDDGAHTGKHIIKLPHAIPLSVTGREKGGSTP